MEDSLTLWARFRVCVLLHEIARDLRAEAQLWSADASGLRAKVRVAMAAAARLDLGR
jgi:hypothetical protein